MTLRYSYRQAALQLRARRTFFSSPAGPATKFTVNKTLPHAQADLFKIISDIDVYSRFVPFCKASRVTQTSAEGRPSRADLVVGYKGYEETFTSDVKCVSPSSVEAVARNHALFSRLATAWRVLPASADTGKSVVHLDIEYKFANPLYGALSQAVLPKVADQVIEAFEKHAAETLSTGTSSQKE